MSDTKAEISAIQMELIIEAPVAKVWQALTEGIGDWWPGDFYAGGTAGSRRFLMEAKPGGRMYEQWQDGGGVLWGTVMAVEPEKNLQVLGHLFPNWGGPAQQYGTWQLTARGEHTRLNYSETDLGRISPEGMREKDKGWEFLMRSLKAYVEGTEAPAWSV